MDPYYDDIEYIQVSQKKAREARAWLDKHGLREAGKIEMEKQERARRRENARLRKKSKN